MSAFSLLKTPQLFTLLLRCFKDAPLPRPDLRRDISTFGRLFSSDHFRRHISFRQLADYFGELLRTL